MPYIIRWHAQDRGGKSQVADAPQLLTQLLEVLRQHEPYRITIDVVQACEDGRPVLAEEVADERTND